MRFRSTSETASVEPRDRSDVRLNFFYGNDPAGWRSNVPVYDRVVYRDLWTGVDLIVRPVNGGMQYAYSKAPPFPAEESPFTFDGAQVITREQDGSSEIEVAGVSLKDRPTAPSDPDGLERSLNWGDPSPTVPESLPGTGETTTLTGSLVFSWGTFIGGTDMDRTHGVTLDAEGRPIVIGYTRSLDFPIGHGGWDTSHNGGYDVFILKMDTAGSRIIWATFLGGAGEDRPMDIKLDSVGNLLVGGTTTSANFPTTPGAWDRTLGGNRDGFLSKFNPDCTQLIWGTYLGGTANDDAEFVWNIEMGLGDQPVVCGRTDSQDFPTTPGAYDRDFAGGGLDGFVARLRADGEAPVWSTYIGGPMTDEVFDFVLDDQEDPILAVMTSSPGMYTSPDAYDPTYNGSRDFMITVLASDGSAVGYSTYFGGPGNEGEARIARDSWGRVLLSGYTTSSTGIAVGDVYDPTYGGGQDAFVARFDAWGTSSPLWCTYLGGSGDDVAEDVFFDTMGDPTFCGYAAQGFPVTWNAFQPVYRGGDSDAFVARLDPQGKTLIYSTYVGGSDHEELWDCAEDSSHHIYVSGHTASPDFPTTPGVFDRTFNSPPGGRDAVLVRFLISESGAGVEATDAARDPRGQAVPNPSAGPVRIGYDLEATGVVSVEIYRGSGAVERRIAVGRQSAGYHEAVWDGRDNAGNVVPSGVYFSRIKTGERQIAGKIIRTK
jgi:hypothetical protein